MSQVGVNKVILIGNVGNDPDVRFSPSGTPMASFSLAVNESFKKKNGEKEARCEWFRCVCWARLAEITGEYVTRGRKVFLEGSLRTRKYDDRNGQARTITEVVVARLQLLDSRKNGDTPQQAPAASSTAKTTEDDSIPF